MRKKIFSILLSVAMVMVMMPSMAFAATTENCSGNCEHQAAIGKTHYDTLVEAVSAVPDKGTVTLLKDCSGAGIGTFKGVTGSVKNFKVDFDGHTYTCTGPAVGSSGTQSQAFHLEWSGSADNNVNVTLENGTLTSTKGSGVYMLVQNYCNLTLNGMILDGSNIGSGNYTLSNNCGDVKIIDTTIIAPENGYAFDACDYSSYTGVKVTVGDSDIRGKIECTNPNGGDNNASIVINGGTFSDFDALNYIGTGHITIKPLNNITKNITIPEGKSVTIDLNQKTLNGWIDQYGDLIIRNGNVSGTVYTNASGTDNKYNQLIVEKDAVIDSDYAVVLYQNSVGANNYGSTIDIYGKLNGNLWVMGNIETSLLTAKNPCVVNVHDGAIIASGKGNVGIALNGAAKMNVDKADISADTGIEVRAGELIVNGATITGNATPTNVTPNGNGTTTAGAGIAIAQHTTKLPINVTINSGMISGYTPLYESNPQNNETMEIINISVRGGELQTINGGTNSVYSENKTKFIEGGSFSSNPTTYVADDAKVYHTSTGMYNVNNTAHTGGNNTWTYNEGTKLYEESYVAPPTPPTPVEKDPVSNEGTAGTDNATTNADITDKVTTSDGKTEAVVDQVIADKIVDKAVENKSTEVVVEATTAAGKSDASQVALPESTVKAIAEQTDAALTIKTDNAEVTLDKEAVSAVVDQAGTTGTVKLVVETVENTAEKVVVELKLETSNGYVSDFKGGNVTVTVPVAKDMADKKVVCVYIDDNGIYHKVDGSLNEAGTHYTFTTGHFSTYAIMSEEEADAVIKDQTAAAEKAAIKKVKATVALSTKNVKKGIKVTVKVPVDQKADKTGIILYRSMKKDSGYAMYKKVETKSSTYIITNTKNVKGNRLTAGKRYYYKARAYKVIDGKTYYGPMSTVKYMKAK